MRLFIGIELPDALRNSTAAAVSRVRERVERSAPSAKVRWIPSSNLHITIWFLGEVREPRVESLVTSLKKPLEVRPFSLLVGGAGAFPPSGAPRAIWLGVTGGHEGLVAIHERLGSRLEPLGFEPETRQFSPHLTIARVKEVRPADRSTMRHVLREDPGNVGGCEVVSATLFVSRPTSIGSHYEVVLPIRLNR